MEQNIVSVERILTYVNVESEAPSEIPETKPEQGWPRAGEIHFKCVSSYTTGSIVILKACFIETTLCDTV